VFLFFAGCVILNTLFAFICLPETKGVPVEKIEEAWDGFVLPLTLYWNSIQSQILLNALPPWARQVNTKALPLLQPSGSMANVGYYLRSI